MYLRTISRRNKNGSTVRYVQLSHNERHPESGNAVARVLHSFGREDQLDRDALKRLITSMNRYLGGDAELESTAVEQGLEFVASRRLGGVWALDGLWRRLGIDTTLRGLLAGRRLDDDVERVLF
ncbi:MAG: IS1634 family transposase, partial [Egibacteraceae bacterium]